MKKFVILIASLSFGFGSIAQDDRGNDQSTERRQIEVRSATALKIQTERNRLITVNIDGRMFSKPSYSMLIDNITSGNHQIVVYYSKIRNNGSVKNYELYRGNIYIRPNNVNIATIYADQTMSMNYEPVMLRKRERNNDESYYRKDDDAYRQQQEDNRYNQSGTEDPQFVSLQKTLDGEAFENKKIDIIDTYIKDKKRITSAQIIALCEGFSFESSRLDVIRKTFQFCSDKSNKIKFYDLFTFSSSKDDLKKIIDNNGPQ